MQVIVDTRELDSLGNRIQQALTHTFRLVALQLWGDIREESPVRTGRLAGSFELNQLAPLTWRIHTAVEYALAVLEGTEAHDIVPVHARALRFQVDGQWVFARRVRHPGTEANPFIDRAVGRTESRLDDLVDQALEAVGG